MTEDLTLNRTLCRRNQVAQRRSGADGKRPKHKTLPSQPSGAEAKRGRREQPEHRNEAVAAKGRRGLTQTTDRPSGTVGKHNFGSDQPTYFQKTPRVPAYAGGGGSVVGESALARSRAANAAKLRIYTQAAK